MAITGWPLSLFAGFRARWILWRLSRPYDRLTGDLACEKIERMGPAVVPFLIKRLLEHRPKDWWTTHLVAPVLGRIKDPRAIEPLRRFLLNDHEFDDDVYAFHSAIEALSSFGTDHVVPPLIEYGERLKPSDYPIFRAMVAETAVDLCDCRLIPMLQKLIDQECSKPGTMNVAVRQPLGMARDIPRDRDSVLCERTVCYLAKALYFCGQENGLTRWLQSFIDIQIRELEHLYDGAIYAFQWKAMAKDLAEISDPLVHKRLIDYLVYVLRQLSERTIKTAEFASAACEVLLDILRNHDSQPVSEATQIRIKEAMVKVQATDELRNANLNLPALRRRMWYNKRISLKGFGDESSLDRLLKWASDTGSETEGSIRRYLYGKCIVEHFNTFVSQSRVISSLDQFIRQEQSLEQGANLITICMLAEALCHFKAEDGEMRWVDAFKKLLSRCTTPDYRDADLETMLSWLHTAEKITGIVESHALLGLTDYLMTVTMNTGPAADSAVCTPSEDIREGAREALIRLLSPLDGSVLDQEPPAWKHLAHRRLLWKFGKHCLQKVVKECESAHSRFWHDRQAFAYLNYAVELEPDNGDLQALFALSLIRLGQVEYALETIRKASILSPDINFWLSKLVEIVPLVLEGPNKVDAELPSRFKRPSAKEMPGGMLFPCCFDPLPDSVYAAPNRDAVCAACGYTIPFSLLSEGEHRHTFILTEVVSRFLARHIGR